MLAVMSAEASQELAFWINEIERFNGKKIWPKPSAVRVVYSDASSTGYGGYTVEHETLVAIGHWSSAQPVQRST